MDVLKSMPAKPFLKWAGGKGRLVPQLRQFYPQEFADYYEPFFGGGAVFFSLQVSGVAHINDINDDLMVAYTLIRDDVDTVVTQLKQLEKHYKLLDEQGRQNFFYEQRTLFNETTDSIEKTVLLIFLNRTCFNGLYRENKKGLFNVPFGRYTNPTICDESNLRAVAEYLRNTEISSVPFDQTVQTAKRGDFVYFDPPYVPLTVTSSFTSYHEVGFSLEDQERLRDLFVMLDKRGCYVMLSNSDTTLVRELYADYKQTRVLAGRAINSKAANRSKIPELVVRNY
jgi:DNA adenine methylase